ncbi:uncharacterized protein LOC120711871 isoform X2 [Panicum virgatum]|uniref:Myb-like domain-containing protein n=1 Tax=Panicum virgatum TaxID=38727 RepID=A0A8T0RC39_PANVG|nr:uncharacterized protein LOC120711871 isoform X2 [Panicum virgatum]KAG2582650.1 hypothetical protein PVAP13_6KG186000 [Panicum virgatum]
MRKAHGSARAPEQSSSGWAARVPEQRGSGFSAATPPRSFTVGSCFFNGGTGGFFSSGRQSPVGQPWNSQSSDPATWGNNATPPGGFTNFMQSQHFNFVGEPSQFAPSKPPWIMQDFQSEEELSTPISSRDNTYVNVDSGDEAPRTEKRIFWTQKEDVRMMSSWLLNSTDSTVGADRKNDQYWTNVEATYNETTPSHRRRNAKQIKDRFHKVTKSVILET